MNLTIFRPKMVIGEGTVNLYRSKAVEENKTFSEFIAELLLIGYQHKYGSNKL